jgi:hypothetical protein
VKSNVVLNVKRKLLQMLQDCAELALLVVVSAAEKIISFKIRIAETSARLVIQELLKSDSSVFENEDMSPSLLHATMTSLESRQSSMSSFSKPKNKKPTDNIYICEPCAKRKFISRAEKIWKRPGKCSFCNSKDMVSHLLEYIPADATIEH